MAKSIDDDGPRLRIKRHYRIAEDVLFVSRAAFWGLVFFQFGLFILHPEVYAELVTPLLIALFLLFVLMCIAAEARRQWMYIGRDDYFIDLYVMTILPLYKDPIDRAFKYRIEVDCTYSMLEITPAKSLKYFCRGMQLIRREYAKYYLPKDIYKLCKLNPAMTDDALRDWFCGKKEGKK